MQFVFVRHAQPEWVRDGLSIDNPGLTAAGRAQAERLRERFRAERVDAILVSPLTRARETAQPIAEVLGIEPEVCEWLAEITAPVWEGTPIEHVQKLFQEHRAKSVDDIWNGLAGGESFHDFHRRVTHGLQEYLDSTGNERVHDDPAFWSLAEPDRRVVVVAHGGTNAAALGYLLGIAPVPWEWERFVSYHAAVSDIHPIEMSQRYAYSLVRFADVAHLPPGLQTR